MDLTPFFKLKSDRPTQIFNLPCLSFYFLGLFGYALRSIDYFSAVPGDFGDDRFNSVILEHLFQWMTGRAESLWSPAFFYPFKHVLAFSDNHFGSAIFYVVWRLFGFSREISFDGWFLIGITLNFFCACWAFRRMGFSQLASASGAFIFSFSLPVLRFEIHAQFVYRFAIPLAYAAFWNLITTKRLFFLRQVIFWGTIQFFCSIYLGVFLCYLLCATLLAWCFIGYKKHDFLELLSGFPKEKITLKLFFCVSILASIAMLAWLMSHYYAATLEYPLGPPKGQLAAFLPRLSYYVIPNKGLFLGFGVWLLFMVGIVKTFQNNANDKIGLIALATFILLLITTLSVQGYSLYLLFAHLPGISAIRVVLRIILVMLLPIGIVAAVGIEGLQKKPFRASVAVKALLIVTLFGLLGTEVMAYHPQNTLVDQWQNRKTTLLEKLPKQLPSHPILYVTLKEGDPFYMAELDGMILSQDLGIVTLNGYSGNVPPGYSFASPCNSHLNRLHGYALYRGLPLSAIEPLAQRVVIIAPTPCVP